MLDEEAARQKSQAERSEAVLFADDLLPGVGTEEMEFKEGIKKGGVYTFGVLLALNSMDELEGAAINILGPDIAETLNVSDGTITFISVASVAFFVLGAGPMGWLADRIRRGPIVGVASMAFAGFAALSGLAINAFMLFWTRFFTGISKANTITVHATLLADTYPIGVRGRIFATNAAVGRVFNAASPILVGGIAVAVGGDEGWRWAYLSLGIPVAVLAVLAFALPEPERGQWEKKDVLGHSFGKDLAEIPISIGAAFARIWRIDTIRYMTMAMVAIGFALFPGASIQSFFLDEEFGLDALERGFATAPTGVLIVAFLPWIGKRFDQTFREAPDKALRIMGLLLIPASILVPLQYSMPNVWLFVVFATLNGTFLGAAFSMVQPSIQSVVPYRLRGMGTAIVTFFMFAGGGVAGGLVSAFLQDTVGERAAITFLTIVFMPLGGYYIMRGSHRVRHDLSLVVEELREEQSYHDLIDAGTDVPVMQVSHIDFSYGKVQVLFDVSFDVQQGETLALLGTNGAGKSTILRVVAGLETPERGVVRYQGRTATFASPETRGQLGIQMLPGGQGIWPSMSIGDNLTIGAYNYRSDAADVQRRIDRVLEMFPALADRLSERAGDLSGGQQQMLALARVMLHEPELLIIDELSLGLAPTVVQELLEHIDTLRAAGQTMIIVEQSLNVALAVSDRAIFLEKGQVRFEGSAQELAARDDLARAVFLGKEGG
ncbi:MAG: MFS transporter [Acidimicrobiaceae bacterium]|nr:MFS transporter [Acidimicrobiaceae bacterium]MYG54801.1 MFS transporter [Acidimicrobiaceae bacterium]MYJ99199.1 MFS transporter [Acidimicrobiaceae bacterium]